MGSNNKPLFLSQKRRGERNCKRRNFKYGMSWDMEGERGKIVKDEWGKRKRISDI